MLFIWHPKCSTCQRAEKFLKARGLEFIARDVKMQPPTAKELSAWQKQSGLPLKRFFNTSGLQYRALGLKERLPEMTEQEQVELLAMDGMLVKRPILITDTAVLVGFRETEWEGML